MKLNKKKHYDQQISYFGKEFRNIKNYNLLPWQESYIKKIKESLLDNKIKGKVLVDVGTGSGYVAVEMARIGLKVIATDLTPVALNNIKNYKKKFRLKNIKTINCKADKMPLEDEEVDYIVANAVLEHIPNEKDAANEWIRILKPGGKLFVTVPLKYKFVLPPFIPLNYLHDKRMGHLRRYDLKSLKNLFKLKFIKVYYTGHFIKMIGFLLNIFLKYEKFDRILEKIDKKWEDKRYGSTNIVVVFQK